MDFDELDEFIDIVKTGKLKGMDVIGYWIDGEQRWLCPECLIRLLETIAPCTAEKVLISGIN